MVFIFFVFLLHIFSPFTVMPFNSGIHAHKTETMMSFEEFRKLDHRNQFLYLTSLADKNGLSFSWHYFVGAYTQDSTAALYQPNEHFIAHQVGELIYNRKGFDGITICTPDFGFGCYHGFLDKAFSKDLSGLPQAVNGCEKVGPVHSGKFESCAHGIGHGVASYYAVGDLSSALKTCGTLTAGQISCADGVFMEFSIDAPLSFYKTSDLLYPCDAVEKIYTHACGRYQPSVLERMHMTRKDIAAICASSLDTDFKLGCFDALAFSTTDESGGDTGYIISQCSQILATPLFRYECLKSAAEELVFDSFPGWKEKSFVLCDEVPEERKTECYQYVKIIIQQYH